LRCGCCCICVMLWLLLFFLCFFLNGKQGLTCSDQTMQFMWLKCFSEECCLKLHTGVNVLTDDGFL
jgi:hypothetical protein